MGFKEAPQASGCLKKKASSPRLCSAFFGQSLPSWLLHYNKGSWQWERDKMALTREPTASPKSKTSVSTGEEEKDSKLMLFIFLYIIVKEILFSISYLFGAGGGTGHGVGTHSTQYTCVSKKYFVHCDLALCDLVFYYVSLLSFIFRQYNFIISFPSSNSSWIHSASLPN